MGVRQDEGPGSLQVVGERLLAWAEMAIYGLVAVLLVVGAALLLGSAVHDLVTHLDEGTAAAVTSLLAALLLVFIFVELLSAVRSTVAQQGLVAEPFLLVGIIASIKEIVLIASAPPPDGDDFAMFRDSMVEIGVLTGVVLLLSISALLLRRRQREPQDEAVA
jgi:uncharacterized membrane protein (DUF373 family)